jgi:hypothetical protein
VERRRRRCSAQACSTTWPASPRRRRSSPPRWRRSSTTNAADAAQQIDTSGVSLAVNVGGATGEVVRELMRANDKLRGMVLDLPQAARPGRGGGAIRYRCNKQASRSPPAFAPTGQLRPGNPTGRARRTRGRCGPVCARPSATRAGWDPGRRRPAISRTGDMYLRYTSHVPPVRLAGKAGVGLSGEKQNQADKEERGLICVGKRTSPAASDSLKPGPAACSPWHQTRPETDQSLVRLLPALLTARNRSGRRGSAVV